MTIEIRAASASDADQLVGLIWKHAAFEKLVASVTSADLGAILEAEPPPTMLIVADDDGELIGYAALTFDYALLSATRFGHLDCLFVADGRRGKGIGKRLFDHVCGLAAATGVPRLEWQTPAWNADAIRFYTREGATSLAKMRFSRVLA